MTTESTVTDQSSRSESPPTLDADFIRTVALEVVNGVRLDAEENWISEPRIDLELRLGLDFLTYEELGEIIGHMESSRRKDERICEEARWGLCDVQSWKLPSNAICIHSEARRDDDSSNRYPSDKIEIEGWALTRAFNCPVAMMHKDEGTGVRQCFLFSETQKKSIRIPISHETSSAAIAMPIALVLGIVPHEDTEKTIAPYVPTSGVFPNESTADDYTKACELADADYFRNLSTAQMKNSHKFNTPAIERDYLKMRINSLGDHAGREIVEERINGRLEAVNLELEVKGHSAERKSVDLGR